MKYVSLGSWCFWGEVAKILNLIEGNSEYSTFTNFLSYGFICSDLYDPSIDKKDESKNNFICNLYDLLLDANKFNTDWLKNENITDGGLSNNTKMINFYFDKDKNIFFKRHLFNSKNTINSAKISMQYIKFPADVYIYGGNFNNSKQTKKIILHVNDLILKLNKNAQLYLFSECDYPDIHKDNIKFFKMPFDDVNLNIKNNSIINDKLIISMKNYKLLCNVFKKQLQEYFFKIINFSEI